MTMSAPVKFNPVPPAFKEIKKTGVSSELNCSVKAKRSFVYVEPVNIKCLISLAVNSLDKISNMHVNCEKINTL